MGDQRNQNEGGGIGLVSRGAAVILLGGGGGETNEQSRRKHTSR